MPREQNYLTVDKECQAIKRELEVLKHTLIGRHRHVLPERGCRKPDNPSAIPLDAGQIHWDQRRTAAAAAAAIV